MDLTEMAGHLVRRLHQISTTTFYQHVKDAGYDITPVQFAAMHALSMNPDIEQAQVSALIAYDRATIGGVIDRLEQKGYISRSVSSKDKRARVCRLSSEGQKVIQLISPIVESLQHEILCGLDEHEYQQFMALAQKAVNYTNQPEQD